MAKKAPAAGKAKPAAQTPEVLPPAEETTIPEASLALKDGTTIMNFLEGAEMFFTTARSLERAATAKLATSRALTLPEVGDVAGDEKLQTFIREASAEKKEIETHWGITSLIHKFHRTLTAARDRGVDALTEAQTNAQRLHNQYEERRKRLEVEERQRLDAEERQRAEAQRQRELENMEKAALEREAHAADLSERETIFVDRILAGDDEHIAARTAGFRDWKVQGDRLIKSAKIVAAVSNKREAIAIRQQAEAHASRPLDVQKPAAPSSAATQKAKAGSDVAYHYGDVEDGMQLIMAVIGGKHGIPPDVLMVNPTKLNEYAKSLGELINRWPGVRYRKETKTR